MFAVKMLKKSYLSQLLLSSLLVSSVVNAAEDDEPLQDMSDPLAVYTQGGVGLTDKGINFKVGQSYDTGNPETMGMNLIELKGALGGSLGWAGSSQRNDAVDSMRFRNFGVNLKNGRGSQTDITYDFNHESGSMTYSLLQSLPKMGRFNLYPLAGVGLAFANNALQDDGTIASGYTFPGTLAVLGMYGKFTITDKIWLNYNPIWTTSLSGSDNFKDYGFEGDSSVFAHEFIVSYQLNKRSNIRLFANWSENISIGDGDHRVEYNYQF